MQEAGLVNKRNAWPSPTNLEEDLALLYSQHSGYSGDTGRLQLRLKATAMLPFFFAAFPPTAKFHHLDGFPLIECLKSLTGLTESIGQSQNTRDMHWASVECSASKLNYTLVISHALSLVGVTEKIVPDCLFARNSFAASWCSIAITSGLYLHGVLGLSNADKPIERQLFRLLMTMLVRDLNQASNESNVRILSDLWFWQHFVGAYSLAWHQSYVYDETMQAIESYFHSSIRSWSEACNVAQWEEAQQRLFKVAWSLSQPQVLAERVWERALRKQQRARKPKVRTGCVTCKARHVKCDERKPSCLRCERAGVSCSGFIKAPIKKKPEIVRSATSLIPIRPRPEKPEYSDTSGQMYPYSPVGSATVSHPLQTEKG